MSLRVECAKLQPAKKACAGSFAGKLGIPSTTGPMTWWILPSWVLANLAWRAGAKLFWMGLKARCGDMGDALRSAEARSDRATPLLTQLARSETSQLHG